MNTVGSNARFPWRAFLYAVVILYLIADLHWFGGPLRQRLDARRAYSQQSLQRALEKGWVGTVNGEPLTIGQLDQATAVYLHRQGKTPQDLTENALRISRRAALLQLIDDTMVRQYAAADEFKADPEAIRVRIAEFEAQFATPDDLATRREALGLNEEALHALLAEKVMQEQWLESRISEAMHITEEDLRTWYDENVGTDPGIENPQLIRARHLFLSTVDEDTPEREAQIREMHRQLTTGEIPFETLAATFSEDERTKHRGGDLGWFGTERMPEDFSDIAFGLRPGQRSEPFRSSLGWHILEVTDTHDGSRLDFETLRPEIAAWVETERRRYAIQVQMNRLKTVAVTQIFPENFDTH
ncbi:MAG: peptidylprolyl isomerase [Verrucomicrobiae bacterium]|nr:peptidylprolyl isomerase [Verrucomicrobiae bacterium]